MIALVMGLVLAGCLGPEDDHHALKLILHVTRDGMGPDDAVRFVGQIFVEREGVVRPIAFTGFVYTTWIPTGFSSETQTWTHKMTVSADSYELDQGGPRFRVNWTGDALPQGCFMVHAYLRDGGGPSLASTEQQACVRKEHLPSPMVGLISESAKTNTVQWTLKVPFASHAYSMTDYRFTFQTPTHGAMTGEIQLSPQASQEGHRMFAQWLGAGNQSHKVTRPGTIEASGFEFLFRDQDSDGNLSRSDTITVRYDDDDDGSLGDVFPGGDYRFYLHHDPSGSSAGDLPRTF